MNWNIHHKNFYVQWVLKLFHPRLALWTKIIDVWLDMPRHIIIDKISKTKQKEILSKIPNGASYFKRCLKEFWKREIQIKIDFEDKKKRLSRDFFEPFPVLHNHLFKVSDKYCDTLDIMDFKYIGKGFDFSAMPVGSCFQARFLQVSLVQPPPSG